MLTIHKNTRERRAAKNMRKEMMQDAKRLSQLFEIGGFAIVVWNKDCASDCAWRSTPPLMPGLVLPEFIKQTISRRISTDGVNKIIDERLLE